jgi:hypothetical protein
LTLNKFGFLVFIYNFGKENAFDRLISLKLNTMKGNILIDFLVRNGFLPNNKKPVLAPVPVKSKSPLPARKGN